MNKIYGVDRLLTFRTMDTNSCFRHRLVVKGEALHWHIRRRNFLNKLHPKLIELLQAMMWVVDKFLQKFKKSMKYDYISLKHPMKTWDFNYEALIVSEETSKAMGNSII